MQAIRQNEQVNRLPGDTDLNRFAYPGNRARPIDKTAAYTVLVRAVVPIPGFY